MNQKLAAQADQIEQLETQLATVVKSLQESPESAELLEQVNELNGKLDSEIEKYETMEKSLEAAKERAKFSAKSIGIIQSRGETDTSTLVYDAAAAHLLAHMQRKTISEVLNTEIKDATKKSAVASITKHKADAAHLSTAHLGAELAGDGVARFWDDMRLSSAAMQLANLGTRLNFDGYKSITVPSRDPDSLATPTTEPAFVGEGGVIPLMNANFSSKKLEPNKLAAITGWTRELENATLGEVSSIMRNFMLDAYAQRLDEAVFSDVAAVAGVRPAGLRNGLAGAATGAGNATLTGADLVLADLKTLVSFLQSKRTLGRPVIVMNSSSRIGLTMMQTTLGELVFRDEITSSGTLLGVPIIDSIFVPAGVAMIVDASSFVAAFGPIEFMTSEHATLSLANADATAPTQAIDKAGQAGTAGEVGPDAGIQIAKAGASSAEYRNLFQTWSVALRMVSPCSFGMVRSNAVAELKTIKW